MSSMSQRSSIGGIVAAALLASSMSVERKPASAKISFTSSVWRYSTNASATSRTQCLSTFASTTVTGFSIRTLDGG